MEAVKKTVRHLASRSLQPALDAQRAATVADVRALLEAHWQRLPAALARVSYLSSGRFSTHLV